MAELITMSEFARRKGVSPQAVSKAVQSRRIGVVHDGKGRPKLDWEIASDQWERTSRRAEPGEPPTAESQGTQETSGADYFSSRAEHERLKAELARLKFEEESGQLVRADDVRFAWGKIVAAVKSKVQAIPAKAKVRLPHLTIEDMEVLEDLIRESLTELADWRIRRV